MVCLFKKKKKRLLIQMAVFKKEPRLCFVFVDLFFLNLTGVSWSVLPTLAWFYVVWVEVR